MLKKKDWSVENIVQQIRMLTRECRSYHNDGYTAFELKKDLYLIKSIVDQSIKDSPSFEGEQDWLTEQEQKRIIDILKS